MLINEICLWFESFLGQVFRIPSDYPIGREVEKLDIVDFHPELYITARFKLSITRPS